MIFAVQDLSKLVKSLNSSYKKDFLKKQNEQKSRYFLRKSIVIR